MVVIGKKVNKDNTDAVNLYFSLEDLCRAIKKRGRTALGKDGIRYGIFRRLDDSVLQHWLSWILYGEKQCRVK